MAVERVLNERKKLYCLFWILQQKGLNTPKSIISYTYTCFLKAV